MGPALKSERCALGFSEVHACVSPGKAALSLRKAELGVWACVPPPAGTSGRLSVLVAVLLHFGRFSLVLQIPPLRSES